MPTKKPTRRAANGRTRRRMKISSSSLNAALYEAEAKREALLDRLFTPYKPAPGVVPTGAAAPSMAMDETISDWSIDGMAGSQSIALAASMIAEGQIFLGFPLLSELAQRPEFRTISNIFATEMTRKWIRFKGTGGKDAVDKTQRIKELEAAFKKFKIREKFKEIALHEGLFGRAHLAVKIDKDEVENEKKTSIGDGWSKTSKGKIRKGSIKGFKVIEPIWCYPAAFNSTDPVAEDFYQPQTWYVMGKEYHRTRLLTFVGRDVPDILKAAYAFCGLSRSQMARPYVENWLRTRQGVAEIVTAFSTMVLKTNMEGFLDGESSDSIVTRAAFFNATRSNKGMMLVDKDTEDLTNVAAPLGTLDALQAQAQEQMCSVSQIPLVKFTGLSPKGLNASSEGEIRVFYDVIHSEQEGIFGDNLRTIVGMVMLHLWGEVDEDIESEFVELWELTEKEAAELRKTEADTDATLADLGAISPEEIRARIASDPDTPYAGLDPNDMPEPPPQEGEEGMLGAEGEGGPDDGGALEQEPPGQPQQPAPREPANDRELLPREQRRAAGMAQDDSQGWVESEHKRGQPGNAGQFASGGKAAAGKGAAPKVNMNARAGHQPTKIVKGQRVMADGKPLPAHIQKLRIPPAWTNVTVHPSPEAALQVVGKDQKGRDQYVYSAAHVEAKAAAKFSRIAELDRKFDSVFQQNEQARKSKDPATRDAADCAFLIMKMGVRPGSEDDTGADKQAFGATTLQGKHVVVKGDRVSLKFTGKKGVDLDLPVTDPGVRKMLLARKAKAGANGQLFGINEKQLLDHVHGFDGGGFKTKDFRTLTGTRAAQAHIANRDAPTDAKSYKKAVKEVATEVSQILGNTPSVALASYINPMVFAPWRMAAGV